MNGRLGISAESRCRRTVVFAALMMLGRIASAAPTEPIYPEVADGELPTADGFRGIWYANEPSHDEYVFKYSGGMATYPHQQMPIAIYAPSVNKTFFVYGGRY